MDTGTIDRQLADITKPGMLKRAHRAQRRVERSRERARWRLQVRCFWTWPFRHEWVTLTYEDGLKRKCCVGCRKSYITR